MSESKRERVCVCVFVRGCVRDRVQHVCDRKCVRATSTHVCTEYTSAHIPQMVFCVLVSSAFAIMKRIK
jgi:hypothetical protein